MPIKPPFYGADKRRSSTFQFVKELRQEPRAWAWDPPEPTLPPVGGIYNDTGDTGSSFNTEYDPYTPLPHLPPSPPSIPLPSADSFCFLPYKVEDRWKKGKAAAYLEQKGSQTLVVSCPCPSLSELLAPTTTDGWLAWQWPGLRWRAMEKGMPSEMNIKSRHRPRANEIWCEFCVECSLRVARTIVSSRSNRSDAFGELVWQPATEIRRPGVSPCNNSCSLLTYQLWHPLCLFFSHLQPDPITSVCPLWFSALTSTVDLLAEPRSVLACQRPFCCVPGTAQHSPLSALPSESPAARGREIRTANHWNNARGKRRTLTGGGRGSRNQNHG